MPRKVPGPDSWPGVLAGDVQLAGYRLHRQASGTAGLAESVERARGGRLAKRTRQADRQRKSPSVDDAAAFNESLFQDESQRVVAKYATQWFADQSKYDQLPRYLQMSLYYHNVL